MTRLACLSDAPQVNPLTDYSQRRGQNRIPTAAAPFLETSRRPSISSTTGRSAGNRRMLFRSVPAVGHSWQTTRSFTAARTTGATLQHFDQPDCPVEAAPLY